MNDTMARLPDDLAGWLRDSQAQMQAPEQLLLYSLILGLQPQSVLEIGVFEGGSSAIILGALGDAGKGGTLYSLEPNELPVVPHNSFWVMVRGKSPDDLAHIAGMSPHPFDFVLVDGDHSKAAVIADVEGVIPYLADDAYLLFHDAYAPGVEDAIEAIAGGSYVYDGVVESFEMIDCGILCKTPVYLEHMGTNYYGMRLVRFERG